MGLTRIRAEQISDIDYKQAVRVLSDSNVTLAGGAPSSVDGVNLVVGDRILVNGQSNAAQNGLYQVQTLGTGSNGTWTRTSDGNEDGEIQPGMIVMVTQGTEYADTPWKLVTNGVIEIGVTELVFEENYSLAFGNVYANGTAVVANVVSAPLTLSAGDNISIVGNNTSKSVTIGVTGITTSRIANGTSNVDIATANGNVTTAVSGNTILTVTTSGANVTGAADITGNITTGNILTDGYFYANGAPFEPGGVPGGSNTSIQFNDDSVFGGTAGFTFDKTTNAVSTSGTITATGNITGGNLNTGAQVVATGNVTGGNLATAGLVSAGTTITATGNVTGGNLTTAGRMDATGNITGGNLNTGAQVVATGNITGGNLTTAGLVSAETTITAAGNITGGNLTTAGAVTATGNVTGGNILGNGAGLTGINVFSNITVSGGSSVLADSISDTLTLVGGDGITITANATTDTITFATSGGNASIFETGGDMGLVTESPTSSEDLGLVTDAVLESYDLGGLGVDGVVTNDDIAVYTITGNRLANNFVYESNFNVQGNLTVQGEITQDGITVPNQNQVFAYILAL